MVLTLFKSAIFWLPLIILPFTIDYYHPPKELLGQVAVIFCLAFWLIKAINDGRINILRYKFFLLLLSFCLISGLSLIWAKNKYLGLRDYIQMLTYIGAFFICINTIGRQKEAMDLANCAFIAGLLCAIYTLFEYFGFDFIRYPDAAFPDWRFKLYSTFGNPDFAANYLILIFPIGVAFYFSKERFYEKILLVLSLIVIYSALLATFSVGALLGLFLSVLFTALLFGVERIRLRNLMCQQWSIPHMGISALILVAALGLASFFFFTDNQVNSASILKRAKSSIAWRHGLSNRLMSYRAAYGMVKDHPISGIGIGNFKFRFPEYRGRVIGARNQYVDSYTLDKERDKHVHSDLIQIWVETGLFGFISFLVILFIVYKNGLFLYYDLFDYRRKLFVLGIICAITAFLIHSFVSFPLHIMPNGLLFWVFAGLLFAQEVNKNKRTVALNIDPGHKSFFKTSVITLAIIACIWPVRIYLSEVFLKRMVDFDKRGLTKEAFVEAKTSLFFDSNSTAVIYVGNYANLANDYDTAASSFKKALMNNDEINFHIALAEVYNKDGFPRDCISEYTRALLLNPSSIPLRLRLAELYTDNMMLNEAEAECQFIIMTNSKDENVNKKVRDILKVLFDKRFLAPYYDKVQINK